MDSFLWVTVALDAFKELKMVLIRGSVLKPTYSLCFQIEYDASSKGIRAVLVQQQKPLAYYSKALHGKNLLLSTYEKELLTLVLAIQQCRQYLFGRQITVCIDHARPRHLWNQKIHMFPQQRWLQKLMGYDFVIQYKKGQDNGIVDGLSHC